MKLKDRIQNQIIENITSKVGITADYKIMDNKASGGKPVKPVIN